ncbi:MAG UNVERIFIED_CONTAM: hypothetical protein LVT10_08865 [Anaerolineae bacterium]
MAGITRVETLLGNEGFVKKAPEMVLKRERDTLVDSANDATEDC